ACLQIIGIGRDGAASRRNPRPDGGRSLESVAFRRLHGLNGHMSAPRPTVFERYPPAPSVISHSLEQTRQAVFWLDELGEGQPHPALSGTVTTDLAIVGGGFTGLWTALRAKQRDPGRRVVLLEAKRIAWAQSGRNGGFVEASITTAKRTAAPAGRRSTRSSPGAG